MLASAEAAMAGRVFSTCSPLHFGVRYRINPWMDLRRGGRELRHLSKIGRSRRSLLRPMPECGSASRDRGLMAQ
jgi:hypothetical protein